MHIRVCVCDPLSSRCLARRAPPPSSTAHLPLHLPGTPRRPLGGAAGGARTVPLRGVGGVDAVRQVRDVEQRGPLVSLNDHFQLAFRPFYQRFCICQRHVFCHGPIYLQQKKNYKLKVNDTNMLINLCLT